MKAALAHKLRRLSRAYRREGTGGTARRLVTWLARRVYRKEEHLVLSRPAAWDLPSVDAGVEVRPLAEGDVPDLLALTRDHARPEDSEYVLDYLGGGYPAFIAFLDGELIGCFWWVDSRIDAEHPDLVLHHIELEEADAYGFYLFVPEEYRGGGVATDFLARVLLEFRRLGYANVQGFVAAGNRPARWLFSLLGFEVTRRVTIRRLFSLLALADRRLLIRNLGRGRRHSFGDRLLVSLGR